MNGALPSLSAAVEGDADEAVIRKLAAEAGFRVGTVYGKTGKDDLDLRLKGYNQAARFAPWLILRDLDHDADCAPELRRRLISRPAPYLCFRIPVRSVEAWLIADRPSLARYLRIPVQRIPREPEDHPRPKRSMVDLARGSRRPTIVRDMVPAPGLSTEVGPAYSARLVEFVQRAWLPWQAARSSPSLERTLLALQRLRSTLPEWWPDAALRESDEAE